MKSVGIAIAAAGLSLAACDRPRASTTTDASVDATTDAGSVAPAAWPDLPAKWDDARALVDRSTKRAPEGRWAELAPEAVVRRIDEGLEKRTLVAGTASVDAWVAAKVKRSLEGNRASYVLVGGSHDARAQIEAFRRLVGPGAPVPFTHVVVEQLRADGQWAHVDRERQRGDDADLADASPRALDALAAGQQRTDYAAWKFGYVDAVIDLVASARAAGRTIVPCDMPVETQALLGDAREHWSVRLRELHCALALSDALRARTDASPPRVAAFWGLEHVEPDGFPRFLPREADVTTLRLSGGRTFVRDLDVAIAKRFALASPVLFAMDDAGRDTVVALPDPAAASRVEVVRVRDTAAHTRGVVEVSSRARADLRIDGRAVVAGPIRQTIAAAAGSHVAVLGRAAPVLVFDVVVPDDGWTEVAADGSDVTVTIHHVPGGRINL